MKKVLFAAIASVIFLGSSCTKITVVSCPTGEHESECAHEPQVDTVYILPGNGGAPADSSGHIDLGGVDPQPGSTGGTGPFPVEP